MEASERPRLWLALALVVTALSIAACSDDDADEGGTTAGGDETETSDKKGGKPILIKTHVAPLNARGETVGEVLSGSTIGDSAFCAGGNFLDGPVKPPNRSVLRTFHCPGGILTITFISTPPSVKQRSDWEVENGHGRFEGLSGGGRMTGVLESGSREGRETFTGTVTR